MVVRLLLADPNTMVRLGYATALAGHEDLSLVAEAATVAEVFALVDGAHPDVVVLDAGLPPGERHRRQSREPRLLAGDPDPIAPPDDGFAQVQTALGGQAIDPRFAAGLGLGRGIRARRPDIGLVLVGPADDDLLFRALQERFSAYLPRSAPVDVLLSAVRHAAAAPTAFTAPDLAAAVARRQAARAALSPREIEVLRYVYVGANNAKIASNMRLTESTVRTYLTRVYDKLGVRTRAQALVAAAERGLLG